MTPIHEVEPVAPEAIYPIHPEPLRRDERPVERPPEDPPIESDTGKILDTYA